MNNFFQNFPPLVKWLFVILDEAAELHDRNSAEVLYCTVRYCTVLYCTVRYCTVRYCTVLYCTVLYCTVLY